MKKFVIYRGLPFKDWHKSFESCGSKWKPGGFRDNCGCPYGKHIDVRFLDYKDPLNLKEIFSLEEGMKLLTFYSWKGSEHLAFHTFEKIEFYSDFIRLIFKEKVDVCEYGGTGEQLTSLRLIAVIEDTNEINAFGKKGGMNVFIEELAKISGNSIEEIRSQIEELDAKPIPSTLTHSTKEITEKVKSLGGLAPIFHSGYF